MFSNAYAQDNASSDDTIAVVEVEETPKSPIEQAGWFGIGANLVPLVLIFIVLYFFLIRPQDKKRKEHENLIKGAKKGEKILTTSGIYGSIVKISDDGIVDIEIAPQVVVTMRKEAIVDIVSRKDNNTLDKAASTKKTTKNSKITGGATKSVKKPI